MMSRVYFNQFVSIESLNLYLNLPFKKLLSEFTLLSVSDSTAIKELTPLFCSKLTFIAVAGLGLGAPPSTFL